MIVENESNTEEINKEDRRRSISPTRQLKQSQIEKRRLTEIPSDSIELYLKNKRPLPSVSHDESPESDKFLESIRHRLQDRRRSTPAALRQAATLSESLNRLALGK